MQIDPNNPFADTDLCVKCGLCLPQCPTYGKTLDESESPRGRLALIQAWAAGQLEATPSLLGHVDNCLLCRSCEAACPAEVPYGRIVDDFRAATRDLHAKSLASRVKTSAVALTLGSAGLQRLAKPATRWLAGTGLLKAAGLYALAGGIPEPLEHAPWLGFHPADGEETARVALFLGCTAELADAETVTAALLLLNRLGVAVAVPEAQACCGAMALHEGRREEAERLRQNNLAAFGSESFDAIVTIASGCGAVLGEYSSTSGFAGRVKDISRFLAEHEWPKRIRFSPLPAKAMAHSPCSLKNVMKSDKQAFQLLRRIPGLQIERFAKTVNCCGAAGLYLLDHPEMAHSLRSDLLAQVEANPPDFLLTSNVGCAMHLRAGLRELRLDAIPVLHPVLLLERQTRGREDLNYQ